MLLSDLIQLVTMEELEGTLKWFNKDNIPGSNGWLMEFYSDFLELLEQKLLAVIEESRITGHIHPH